MASDDKKVTEPKPQEKPDKKKIDVYQVLRRHKYLKYGPLGIDFGVK